VKKYKSKEYLRKIIVKFQGHVFLYKKQEVKNQKE